jgi:chemotaxis protein MotB
VSSLAATKKVFLAGCAFGLTACVSNTRYQASVKDAEQARSEAARSARESDLQLQQCRHELEQTKASLEDRERQLTGVTIERHNLQAQLDESTAIEERLRDELQRLGKNVDELLADRGAMSHALEDAKGRLEELRKAQAATEAKALLFRQLLLKFKKLTDAGQLHIVLREGRLVLQLPGDVLFDSGQTVVKPDGQRALEQVASVLKTLNGKKFQVSGHTDNVPIDSGRFASNWELSAARALAVVHLFTARGVAPQSLSAAGYGEFSPVAPNETPELRARNRRIEIALVPDMEELVNLPSTP